MQKLFYCEHVAAMDENFNLTLLEDAAVWGMVTAVLQCDALILHEPCMWWDDSGGEAKVCLVVWMEVPVKAVRRAE